MSKELFDRINGMESIVQCLHINFKFLMYLAFGVHGQPFNVSSNYGLYWVWGNIMGAQLLDFYKVIGKHEKFSFTKIINLAKNDKVKADFAELEIRTESVIERYSKTNFESVRSKYLAHQDLDVPNLRTNLKVIGKLTQEIKVLFSFFCKEFGYAQKEYSNALLDSFKEIFMAIEEYEKVKALLLSELLTGASTIELSRIQELVGE